MENCGPVVFPASSRSLNTIGASVILSATGCWCRKRARTSRTAGEPNTSKWCAAFSRRTVLVRGSKLPFASFELSDASRRLARSEMKTRGPRPS
jgi:hypothetical protein